MHLSLNTKVSQICQQILATVFLKTVLIVIMCKIHFLNTFDKRNLFTFSIINYIDRSVRMNYKLIPTFFNKFVSARLYQTNVSSSHADLYSWKLRLN